MSEVKGCLYCTDGCKFCQPESPYPEWFNVGKTTPMAWIERVRYGLHPAGMPLMKPAPHGAQCGTCKHQVDRQLAKVYHKCTQIPMTGGLATDVRLKWPACIKWEARS